MLKKIIIQGFKSFAEKTEISFDASITGIVGPNGSGKSNVAEAIRWALGETKTKVLRFERQQDVIFTGSQGKKPVGMAEVTLILDNSNNYFSLPYDEIAITRRCYRSGESEFFINKSPCRLKDIHELLVDTGLGKHGYAIIGQGQVDEILFSSPEEKRSYLEEAAGINRFRWRELEAKKKLLETQSGITRLEDLSRELFTEYQEKETEVNKARTYLLLKEELTAKAKRFYGVKIKSLLEEVQKNEKKISALKNTLDETQFKITKLEAEYAVRISEEEQLANNRDSAQKIVISLENCLDKLLNEKKFQQHEESRLLQNLVNLKEQIQINGNKLAEVQKELKSFYSQVNLLKEKEKEIIIKINNQREKLGVDEEKLLDLRKSLEEQKDEQFELNFREVSLKNEIGFITERIDRLTKECLKIEGEISELTKEISEAECLLNNLVDDKKQALIKLDGLKKERGVLEERVLFLKKEIEILQKEQSILEKRYHETSARLQILNKLEESYEGYGKEIKNLFEAKQKGILKNPHNIIGTVGEYLEVNEKYRLAIETALGASIKNVIVNNAQELEPILVYLKENKLGRITFLALDLLSVDSLKTNFIELKDVSGFIGKAIDLITFPQKLSKVYESLLGKVLVGTDYQACLKIAKITKHKFKVVSLEGELLLPGGAIVGGSFASQSSVLQRKNEIKFLNKQINELLEKKAEVTETIKKLIKEQEELTLKIANLREEVNKTEGNITEMAFKEESLQEKKDRLVSRYLELKNQLGKNIKERDNLIAEKETREKEILKINETKAKLQDKIRNLEEQISTINNLIEKNQNYHQALNLEKIQVEKALENLNNLIREKRYQQKEIFERQLSNARKAIEAKKTLLTLRNDLINLEKKTKVHQEVLMFATNSYEKIKNSHESLKAKLTEVQYNLSQLQKFTQRQIADLTRLEAKQRALIQEINSIKLLLNEKYGIVLGDEETISMDESNIEETDIETLYQQLQDLGTVNVFVIDEHKRLEERINFLNKQKRDLEEAKEQLENLLEQLNKEIEQKFNEFLNLLNREYDLVFKELFGGGRAALEKITGEFKKEGVEIIVELPGKKRQPLGLLSGGERALATIALLFALFNLKPSPFCVLDEIDAALDEVNVQRFSSYLKKIGQKSQVIIITHRRGSMEACSKLVGISMQEGCSKVLSISLQNIKAG
ncbi:chromosome segregation protein SMC [Carboxydothermus pertinax]|uniref:Chromosome partition protein Smc n=1 Tax=Carboxydothermus pertinax TaxID=870242 RepID=A0A1L8CXM9_9THEO|nr:chromosome segregation protein SMC [Carboxydothermus pertinax]GAV23686.1 chromosome segregation protein SMC [Carboxydothermus pertinax]